MSAALSAVYDARDQTNLTIDPLIVRLANAIVKSGTSLPLQRSRVMEVTAFVRMFQAWAPNGDLSVKQLRLKALTLLAIALMLRPSDVAPMARHFDACSEVSSRFIMSTDQVTFCEDGSMKMTFLGIKKRICIVRAFLLLCRPARMSRLTLSALYIRTWL